MNSQKRIICRICFQIQDELDYFKAVKEDLKNALDKVLQNLNLTTIHSPVICSNCADTLMICFDFKLKCINTHDYIDSFINKDVVKLDLIDAYKTKNINCTGVTNVYDVCGLCMSPVEKCSALSIGLEGDVTLKNMIEQCLPELDMNMIEKPVICLPCHGSLESYSHLLTNCLITEEKIKKYCESQGMNSNLGIDLSCLLQFATTDITGNVGGRSTDLIKIENQFCEEAGAETEINNGDDVYKFEQMLCNDRANSEELALKSESFMDTGDVKFNSAIEPFCEENRLKEENLVEMENKHFLPNEKVEIKLDESNFNRFEDILPQPKSIKINSLMYKDSLGVTIYKCDFCTYQAKRKDHIKRHLLKHKDPSEVTMYNCEFCVYQTTRRDTFELHLLTHKNPSEAIMYKCELCPFQAKHRSYLKKHSLVHKDSSELTMYKCESCSFKTKHKKNLDSHLLKHKDSSEVTMYKCSSCSYQTNRERNIRRHLLKHKDPSEVTMYKCNSCSYQAKSNDNLKRHSLKHKDPSELTMFKCDCCSYQAKNKENLKRHLLKHKDSSEVTIYHCDSCVFETKHKRHLDSHWLKHKDPSNVTIYKCDSCSFQSKYKKSLNRHLLKHKDPSEVTI